MIAEWISIYTQALFDFPKSRIQSMYTLSNSLFEAASVVSLLIFGSLRFRNLASVMAVYLTAATLFVALPMTKRPMLYYASSLLTGFFLSVPYASLELVLMDVCTSFNLNRVLSVVSLCGQVAAALAGYPTSLLFSHLCPFEYAPLVQAAVLVVACFCIWIVVLLKNGEIEIEKGKEKEE